MKSHAIVGIQRNLISSHCIVLRSGISDLHATQDKHVADLLYSFLMKQISAKL